MIGKVKNIKPSGYGFIEDESGTQYFMHISQYQGDWDHLAKISPPKSSEGPSVQFKATTSPKGPRAEAVVLLQD